MARADPAEGDYWRAGESSQVLVGIRADNAEADYWRAGEPLPALTMAPPTVKNATDAASAAESPVRIAVTRAAGMDSAHGGEATALAARQSVAEWTAGAEGVTPSVSATAPPGTDSAHGGEATTAGVSLTGSEHGGVIDVAALSAASTVADTTAAQHTIALAASGQTQDAASSVETPALALFTGDAASAVLDAQAGPTGLRFITAGTQRASSREGVTTVVTLTVADDAAARDDAATLWAASHVGDAAGSTDGQASASIVAQPFTVRVWNGTEYAPVATGLAQRTPAPRVFDGTTWVYPAQRPTADANR